MPIILTIIPTLMTSAPRPHGHGCPLRYRGCPSQAPCQAANPSATHPAPDWPAIDARRWGLAEPRIASAYFRSKCRDFNDLCAFLRCVPPDRAYGSPWPVSPATCTGLHVVDYMLARSLRPRARTVVHTDACPQGLTPCACPRTLAHGTIDSTIGRLRAGFIAIDRSAADNPAASPCVKEYLADAVREQARAGITPRRACPVFSDKLGAMFQDMLRVINDPTTPPSYLFATLRQRAIFALALRSLKRGAELMRLPTARIIAFPDGNGLVFNFTWGKTLRNGATHAFGIRRDTARPDTCAVAHVIAYVQGALALGVDLALPGPRAPLFRPWLGSAEATVASTTHLAVRDLNISLRAWLERVGLFDGETFQGFRSGGAIEMALVGEPLAAIMERGYWATARMATHYMGFDRSVIAGGPAPAASASASGLGGLLADRDRDARLRNGLSPPPALLAAWRDANTLRGFYKAFPALGD